MRRPWHRARGTTTVLGGAGKVIGPVHVTWVPVRDQSAETRLAQGELMKSLADGLPPDIASQVHPDWRRNEAEYWKVRDQVLEQHRGQWIAFADGAVIASDRRPVPVYQSAQESGKHPYVIRAGHEDEPCRIRRSSFAYDQSYGGESNWTRSSTPVPCRPTSSATNASSVAMS
jgi:hypothetical protein